MDRLIKVPIQAVLIIVLLLGMTGIILADEPPQVRVVHAASGLPALDFYVNDILFFDNISYHYISSYAPVEAGDRSIKIAPSGVTLEDSTLREVTEPYGNDRHYTVVVAGRVRDIQYWRLEDNLTLPGDGTAQVRFVHASFNTPTAELCLGDVCRTLAFKQNSDYFLLDPGTYTPHLRLNGVEMTAVTIPPLTLQNNGVHTVFLVGQLQDQPTGLQLLYTFDNGETLTPPYPQPPAPGAGAPPSGPSGPGSLAAPAPEYPPVTGAFLSPGAISLLITLGLVSLGGVGIWYIRR